MCVASENCKLQERVEAMDDRIGKVEVRIDKLESALNSGFTQVNTSIQQLATDFSSRMTNIDTRLVESKVKWGEWARSSLNAIGRWLAKWGAVVLLVALGLANAKNIASFFGYKVPDPVPSTFFQGNADGESYGIMPVSKAN